MKNLNVSAIRGNSASVDVLKSVEILIPRGDRVIKRGGRILVFATWDCIEDLEDVFE
jgi:Trk K+ transport system NAD-binding subunit